MFVVSEKVLFLKCNLWKWKIKAEIKVKEEHTKGTTIFVFIIFITYIDDLKINANNVIDVLLIGPFFGGLSFHFFFFFPF